MKPTDRLLEIIIGGHIEVPVSIGTSIENRRRWCWRRLTSGRLEG
jgi:hypothetical protein